MVAWQFSIFPGNNKAKNKGLRCRGSRFRGVIWSFQKRFLTPRHEVSNGWVWYQNFSGRWDCYFKTCRTAIRGDLFFWGFWWLSLSELWYGFESHDDDFRVVRIAFGLKWFSKLFHVVTIFLINQTLMVWSYAWYFCWFHLHSLTQIFRVLQLFFSYRPTQTYPAIRIHPKAISSPARCGVASDQTNNCWSDQEGRKARACQVKASGMLGKWSWDISQSCPDR